MKIFKILSIVIFAISTFQLSAWGGKGHDIIAQIAEQNLSKKAKKEVSKLLKGKKMVYYAVWMDNLRNDSIYDFTSTWHYANVDSGQTYESMPKVETGDVVTATDLAMRIITSKTENDSVKGLYLKLLIHLVGDLHCPMHAGRLSDRGGNRYPIIWFNRDINLHSLWDTQIIESARNWSYSEWAVNLMADKTPVMVVQMQKGTPRDWFLETVSTADFVYNHTPQKTKLSYKYLYDYSYILEQQLTLGGYRLAYLLNTMFN
jgi:hypothetical protein